LKLHVPKLYFHVAVLNIVIVETRERWRVALEKLFFGEYDDMCGLLFKFFSIFLAGHTVKRDNSGHFSTLGLNSRIPLD
jgi:hypothetical protein